MVGDKKFKETDLRLIVLTHLEAKVKPKDATRNYNIIRIYRRTSYKILPEYAIKKYTQIHSGRGLKKAKISRFG